LSDVVPKLSKPDLAKAAVFNSLNQLPVVSTAGRGPPICKLGAFVAVPPVVPNT